MTIPAISVRKDSVGGPVLDVAQPEGFELQSSRLIILIHGYNNTKDSALGSYSDFLKNSGLDQISPVGQSCGFLWPGDKGWGLLSFFSYPFELQPAKDSARVLNEFLLSQNVPGNWPLEVMLVCHSLGNRVGLELVRNYIDAEQNGATKKIIYRAGCFMAAAVPVSMVAESGDLHAAAEKVENKLVLFSEADIVLHWAFPIGETVAGEGVLPLAVGRFGQPSGLWNSRANMGQYNYNHWYYWDHKQSADAVATFLGQAVANKIPSSTIASHETPAMQEPISREIPSRGIKNRQLASAV